MPTDASNPQSWLRSPLSSRIGTIRMAGSLHDTTTIPREQMRVLGSYALILALEGNGFYADASGQDRALEAGDAVLVFPHLAHAYGTADNRPWKQLYVVFDGSVFDLLHESELLRPDYPVWRLEPPDLWRRRCEELFLPLATHNPFDALQTVGRFVQLLTEMVATEAAARRRPENAWLETSLHLLAERQPDGWLSAQNVARRVGMGYDTFRKRFAEETGQPPGRFQQQRRIDYACTAIYRGMSNFQQLAEELDFCDPFHFSKVFRKVTGESPSDYRRRVRGV